MKLAVWNNLWSQIGSKKSPSQFPQFTEKKSSYVEFCGNVTRNYTNGTEIQSHFSWIWILKKAEKIGILLNPPSYLPFYNPTRFFHFF